MSYKSFLAAAVLTGTAGLLPLFSSSASASVSSPSSASSPSLSPSPAISRFSPTQGPVATTVTISGTNLADATSVMFGRTAATVVLDQSTKVEVQVPTGAATSAIRVDTPAGRATSRSKFVVTTPLGGVVSLAGGGNSYCAVLTSGGVDCWGRGLIGELGDGKLSSTSSTSTHRRAFPQAVVGVGDSGTLSGVVGLVSDGTDSVVPSGYCAVLATGGVDCWGDGQAGELGNGVIYNLPYQGSAVPVPVLGVGGSGTLTGVVRLVSGPHGELGGSSAAPS